MLSAADGRGRKTDDTAADLYTMGRESREGTRDVRADKSTDSSTTRRPRTTCVAHTADDDSEDDSENAGRSGFSHVLCNKIERDRRGRGVSSTTLSVPGAPVLVERSSRRARLRRVSRRRRRPAHLDISLVRVGVDGARGQR